MKPTKDQWILLCTGLTVALLMAALFIARPQFVRFFDYKVYDQMLRLYHKDKATNVPVIIDIDEKSLAEYGQWPWPRYRVAILLQSLRKLGAASVATDIIFVEPDKTSPNALQQAWKRDLKLDFDFSALPHGLRDNDVLLADNLKTGPFVLGIDFIAKNNQTATEGKNERGSCTVKPVTVNVIGPPSAPSPHDVLGGMERVICPVPVLGSAARATGFITIAPDEDSLYRRAPLLISFDGKFYPSLALASLMQASGENSLTLRMTEIGVESLRLGKQVIIPLDAEGRLSVNYRGPARTFEYISAADVLNRRVPAGHLKGRMAFIGTSASGLRDIRSMPLDPSFPGVETHATIVDNILSSQFLRSPDWTIGAELGLMLLAGIITTLLLIRLGAVWMALPVIGMSLGIWYGSVYWYTKHLIYLSPLYSLMTLLLTFTTLTAIKFWREEHAKRFIHGAFAHYLAPSVISQIMADPDALSLEGQEKEVSIQFSDVRNFTSLSEKLSPTQVTELLRDYLTPMTRIITEHEGTLDKFIGDAVMAFWNAPLDIDNHQEKALKAAMKQLDALETLNVEFRRKYGFDIEIGIGLHAGPVRVGNMGSDELFDYTLIGDNVNLASRLEGLTKYYGQRIIVSESIFVCCDDNFRFRKLDDVRVKGREEPVAIYGAYLPAEAEARKEEFRAYEMALSLYLDRRFSEAKLAFEQLDRLGTERVLYNLYIQRCELLEHEPPNDDWDGVFTHETK